MSNHCRIPCDLLLRCCWWSGGTTWCHRHHAIREWGRRRDRRCRRFVGIIAVVVERQWDDNIENCNEWHKDVNNEEYERRGYYRGRLWSCHHHHPGWSTIDPFGTMDMMHIARIGEAVQMWECNRKNNDDIDETKSSPLLDCSKIRQVPSRAFQCYRRCTAPFPCSVARLGRIEIRILAVRDICKGVFEGVGELPTHRSGRALLFSWHILVGIGWLFFIFLWLRENCKQGHLLSCSTRTLG